MGQYYKIIILSDIKDIKNKKEIIRIWMTPRSYNEGVKLYEHSYLNTNFMNAIEHLICPDGIFHMSRIIWAGDYADHEENEENNLYYLMDNYNNKYFEPIMHSNDMNNYKYIVNHTKKMYVIKKTNDTDNNIHPLPLLVLDKYNNDDYFGNNNELCGTWARDIISIEETIPEDYNELEYDFYEYY